MKSNISFLIKLLTVQCLTIVCVSLNFDFFYFVQQWPGSYCDRKASYCYPTTGKPATDFGIHGLWLNHKNGTYPSDCDSRNLYDQSKISHLIRTMEKNWPTLNCPSGNGTKFWQHEWNKHGTCSQSVFSQRQYFEATLQLKKKVDLLKILENAGIKPNGEFYELNKIRGAIKDGAGFTPWIQCNKDALGNGQLYQIYLCVDTCGKNFIECPVMPEGNVMQLLSFLHSKGGGRGAARGLEAHAASSSCM